VADYINTISSLLHRFYHPVLILGRITALSIIESMTTTSLLLLYSSEGEMRIRPWAALSVAAKEKRVVTPFLLRCSEVKIRPGYPMLSFDIDPRLHPHSCLPTTTNNNVDLKRSL